MSGTHSDFRIRIDNVNVISVVTNSEDVSSHRINVTNASSVISRRYRKSSRLAFVLHLVHALFIDGKGKLNTTKSHKPKKAVKCDTNNYVNYN